MITYQDLLKQEYLRRNSKNFRYSHRRYARDLGVSQAFLSQVLNRKKKLSEEKALLLSSRLKLSSVKSKLFVNLVKLERAKHPETKELILKELNSIMARHPEVTILPKDVFDLVSRWDHFAILELTALPNFRLDTKWISRKLQISHNEAAAAVERLTRVGLLVNKNGHFKKEHRNYIYADVPSTAIRRHHHETLDLAHRAIEEQHMNAREFLTICFPMNLKLLTEAKARIREFSESLMADMERDTPTAVYKLAVQFFRLDRDLE